MENRTLVSDRLDDLVFARLATSKQPPGEAELARALRSCAPASVDDVRWADAIGAALERLVAAGDVVRGQPVPRGPVAAGERFGATGPRSWQQLSGKLIPALALGVATTDGKALARLKDRDAWVAAIVGRARGLWTDGAPPSLGAVSDALIWRTLGLTGRPGRSPAAVRAHFVGVVLGGAATGPLERRAALLAAQELGAVRADLAALREALVRRWLAGLSWTPAERPAAPVPARAQVATADFASTVRGAAERATEGVFGPRKVFISSVWRDPAFRDLPLAEFKQRLLDAHRAGTITLARADLVAAMDPELVRESETEHHDSRYHFIERGATP